MPEKYDVNCITWLLASCPNLTASEIVKTLHLHRQNAERKLSRLLEKGIVTRVMLKVPFENHQGIYYRPAWCYSLTIAPKVDTSGRAEYDKDELNIINYLARFPDSSFSELRHGIRPDNIERLKKRLTAMRKRGLIEFEDDLRANSSGGKLKTVRTYHLA